MTVLRYGNNGNFKAAQLAQSRPLKTAGMGPCQTICQPYSAPTPTPCGTKCIMYCVGQQNRAVEHRASALLPENKTAAEENMIESQ